MTIEQGLCSSFKQESWQAIHDLNTDTLKLALYTGSAVLGPATPAYTTAGEVVGPGYAAGGEQLTGVQVLLSGAVAYVTFNNVLWTGTSFTYRAGLIFNASKSNRAIAVLNFGADKIANGQVEIQMPVPGPTTALIRFR